MGKEKGSAQRDRKQTEKRILDAVGKLLKRSGFRDLGVNAIARAAGVDKVLIYRYFGGIPQLLRAFAERSDFWPAAQELAQPDGTPADRARFALVTFSRALRSRPLTQEILRWELMEKNELTDALASYREEQSVALLETIEQDVEADVRGVASIIAAGLTYLALRAKTVDVYNGLKLKSDEDWRRIERAAGFLVDAAFAETKSTKPKPKR